MATGEGNHVGASVSEMAPHPHPAAGGAENSLIHSLVHSVNCVEVLLCASMGAIAVGVLEPT